MNINNVAIKAINLNEFISNVGVVSEELQAQGFKVIRLTYEENKKLEISAVYQGVTIIFELGSENIYLKGTEFSSKNIHNFIISMKRLAEAD